MEFSDGMFAASELGAPQHVGRQQASSSGAGPRVARNQLFEDEDDLAGGAYHMAESSSDQSIDDYYAKSTTQYPRSVAPASMQEESMAQTIQPPSAMQP